ncbi:MAG: hypothetical protein GY793_03290 [Proteobacteria bacterium]|nr:hypothetical protein [Pseudomonadota bacterium]
MAGDKLFLEVFEMKLIDSKFRSICILGSLFVLLFGFVLFNWLVLPQYNIRSEKQRIQEFYMSAEKLNVEYKAFLDEKPEDKIGHVFYVSKVERQKLPKREDVLKAYNSFESSLHELAGILDSWPSGFFNSGRLYKFDYCHIIMLEISGVSRTFNKMAFKISSTYHFENMIFNYPYLTSVEKLMKNNKN